MGTEQKHQTLNYQPVRTNKGHNRLISVTIPLFLPFSISGSQQMTDAELTEQQPLINGEVNRN